MNFTNNNKNMNRNNLDNTFNLNYFGEANSPNKNPFLLDDKKENFSFYEEKKEKKKYKNSQTVNKEKVLFISEMRSEGYKFLEKEAKEFRTDNENNNSNNLKISEPKQNLTENDANNNENQNYFQPKGTENLEEYYNKRMNNFVNYFDRKQNDIENNQAKNLNMNKNRETYNNYEGDDNLNAKPVKRGYFHIIFINF
jgi:hypothetical protein